MAITVTAQKPGVFVQGYVDEADGVTELLVNQLEGVKFYEFNWIIQFGLGTATTVTLEVEGPSGALGTRETGMTERTQVQETSRFYSRFVGTPYDGVPAVIVGGAATRMYFTGVKANLRGM